MARHRATKILATLGPASSQREQILVLAQAGVNVFRLNFSHGSHADHQQRYAHIRSVEKELGKPLGILQDLQGPKIRIGVMPQGAREIKAGELLRFNADEPDQLKADDIPFPHADIALELAVGHVLLIDDGKLKLRVTAKQDVAFEAEVLVGGMLSDRKGVNLPDTPLSLSSLTRKDREDLAFGLALGVDWIALSFVQRAADVQELRGLVGHRAGIMAKIEKPQALRELNEIALAADALMVARGDLGVELPAEDVPTWQRKIIEVSRRHGKPVVVATQMLESMISTPTPTRAEASDVANAVYAGADAVMLSAESASGAYPLEAVQTMARIVARAEQEEIPAILKTRAGQEPDRAALIAAALHASSALMPMACAVTYTTSGTSALRVAQERARLPHIGLTPHVQTARRLCLAWGVQPCLSQDAASVEGMIDSAIAAAKSMGYYHSRKPMAVVAGLPFATAGSTNLLRFVWPEALAGSRETPASPSAMMQTRMKTPYFASANVE
ncbi:pyruvate kinase [Variovorax sp. PCZ-1]|uniref:pyruvate kinase n=1 Tax=Variovorax sp. PCZ-1 TaxID=2835533 RepID=UPI001BCC7A6F|nr:pyruvate kinase [Variovorax sp. PCZ-1]MBS7808291.1 pyruvate kinase [Variovorax sp. PCZ-1]